MPINISPLTVNSCLRYMIVMPQWQQREDGLCILQPVICKALFWTEMVSYGSSTLILAAGLKVPIKILQVLIKRDNEDLLYTRQWQILWLMPEIVSIIRGQTDVYRKQLVGSFKFCLQSCISCSHGNIPQKPYCNWSGMRRRRRVQWY